MSYDQRKLVPSRTHAQAVRALSELLSAAVRQAYVELRSKGLEVKGPVVPGGPSPLDRGADDEAEDVTDDPDEPICVPEPAPVPDSEELPP